MQHLHRDIEGNKLEVGDICYYSSEMNLIKIAISKLEKDFVKVFSKEYGTFNIINTEKSTIKKPLL